jgi:hypothetical protein
MIYLKYIIIIKKLSHMYSLSKYCWLTKYIDKKSSQITNQKDLIKMVGSKIMCARWHLGQVGQRPFEVLFN